MITGDDIRNLRIPIITATGDMDLASLAARVINILLIAVGIIAFIYLLYAGIMYITAANNPDQAKKAQQAVVNIIIGLVVVSLSYLIVRFAISIAQQLSGG